jgi:large subunit ribosomal protein L23
MSPAKKKAKAEIAASAPKAKGASERLMTILIAPHVSEKAARATESAQQYVFRVRTDASKPEIRAAVELMFEVKVERVQTVNVIGKDKRFGRFQGKRPDWKKAYVSLKEGQSIDLSGQVQA